MKSILVVFDARKTNETLIRFSCAIARQLNANLVGTFIESIYAEYISTETDANTYSGKTFRKSYNRNNQTAWEANPKISLFKEECEKHKIPNKIYIDRGEPIQEVIYESRYADLIILDPKMSFMEHQEEMPTHFAKEILTHAECPVLLAPEQYDGIDEVVFCYDGSRSSVFAIKQFAYLFPEFYDTKITLLEISPTDKKEFNEQHRRVIELLKVHYRDVHYQLLKGTPKDELFAYFFKRKRKLVIMGAYGRSLLSNFFRRSNAEAVIRAIDLPVFITHH